MMRPVKRKNPVRANRDPFQTRPMAELVAPSLRFQSSFLDAMEEFVAEGVEDSQTAHWIEEHAPAWSDPAVFADFAEGLVRQALPEEPRPADRVPATVLWWVEGETYLGRIGVRHVLNDFLREIGGHIGYDVRPSRRREGHATAMLAAALPVASALGIDPALVTCDTDNLGSRAVIERNGGVLEDERNGKLRFWVPTSP